MFPDFTRKQKRKYAQQKTQISEKKKKHKIKNDVVCVSKSSRMLQCQRFQLCREFFLEHG
jgi:hypothetical protein